MSASARANTQELTAFDPRRKSRATVCAFTRHPTAVATAVGYLMTLHLPGWVHKVAEILITHCDRQGVYWGKTTGELHRLTGVSPKRIQVAGRELRRLGLVEWKWIKHGRRYPRRTSYHEPVRLGAGDRAGYGGRVWVLQWEKFGVRWPSRKVGKDVAVSDPVGSLMSDPRGSLLRSSRLSSGETYSRSRTRRPDECPATAAPSSMTPASLAPLATREREHAASETPSFDRVSRASPPGPGPENESRSEPKSELKGERAVPLSRAPATVAKVLAALFPATFGRKPPRMPQEAPEPHDPGEPPTPTPTRAGAPKATDDG